MSAFSRTSIKSQGNQSLFSVTPPFPSFQSYLPKLLGMILFPSHFLWSHPQLAFWEFLPTVPCPANDLVNSQSPVTVGAAFSSWHTLRRPLIRKLLFLPQDLHLKGLF